MGSTPSNSEHPYLQPRVWHFGECEFDELRHQLRVRGETVELEAKPLEVLHQLLLRAGEVVRKEELLDIVWPGVLVVDASLATAVSKLRKALADGELIIKTVPKLGYRIAVPVRVEFTPAIADTPTLPVSGDPTAPHAPAASFFQHPLVGWAFAITLLLGVSLGLTAFRGSPTANPQAGPIAILPFQNGDAATEIDYLRSALPDEVANTLSAARSLTIRPLTETARYSGSDLQKAARDLSVNRIVTGRYVKIGDQLQITIEAVDTDQNRVVWRDSVSAPANNLLTLQAQIAALSRGKLAGALGIHDFVLDSARPPGNEEAYELYLRSVALDWDPEPNRKGIDLLRRSVILDPNYGPAWGMLALRYYTESRFGGGGPEILQLADAAAEKQMAVDPDSSDGAAQLAIHRTERGELVKAHEQALEVLRRRPDNPNYHHLLSYVLRYGGSLEEAGRECDTAVLLATKIVWGSCSTTFMELGKYQRSRDFIRKDLSSEWSKAHAIEVDLREGKVQHALQIGPPKIAHWDSYKMLLACAAQEPQPTIKKLATQVEVDDDPEVNYFFAAHLAYCGQRDAALRLLKIAIDRNYCSYPAVDLDPFFDKLRNDPAFLKIRAAGVACHENFVTNHDEPPKRVVLQTALTTKP